MPNHCFQNPVNFSCCAPALKFIKNHMRTAHGVETLTYDVYSDCWTVRLTDPGDVDAAIEASSEGLHFPHPNKFVARGDDGKLQSVCYSTSIPGLEIYCAGYGEAAEKIMAYLESKEV